MSLARVMATAAWAAIESRMSAWTWSQASGTPVKMVSAPNAPSSPMSGAAITEAMPVTSM